MPVQYNDQDDFDHFHTNGVSIDEFNLDTMNVREALKRMMNLLLSMKTCYVGQLALEAGFSLERTELLIRHLINIGRITKVNDPKREIVTMI